MDEFWEDMSWKPSNTVKLVNELLLQVYDEMMVEVLKELRSSFGLQMVSDGSANIAKVRVENISVLQGGESFYWRSIPLNTDLVDIVWIVKYVKEAVIKITDNK